uniref:Uncharacterized protein n=1 Tax=Arundo donax TaxID=35708 RepID=A0A0A9F4F6_ARUDO
MVNHRGLQNCWSISELSIFSISLGF